MKISELDTIKNSTDKYRIKWDAVTAATEYQEEVAEDDAGQTALMDYSRASGLMLTIEQNLTNAHNVKLQRLVTGEYGADSFATVFIAKEKDMTSFTLVTP